MLSIGIDIGSYSVKVAKVRSTHKGYEVVHFAEYPLSQDPNKDHQIEIIEILREVRKSIWEEGTRIVVGAHQYEVSLRRREFQFRERHKILKSLPFELEDDIPFSADNSVFDAKVTHYVGPVTHLIACACPKEHLVQILKKVNDGGVQPDIISVDGLAFSTLFEEWRETPWEYPVGLQALPEASQVDVIINIGHKTTTAAVIKDGYLLDIRLVDWGGKDLAETIGTRYSLHYIEALKELRKKAFILMNNEGATRDQVALSEVVKSGVDVLAQKLRLALMDMKSLYRLEFRQALVIGGVAQLRNLGPYLTQKLEIATNRLGKLDMMGPIDFAASPNGEISLLTAIGLAVEGIKRPKNPPINLLKGEFAQQNQSLRIFWDKWGHALKTAAAAFVLVVIWSTLRANFATTNAEDASELLRTQAKNILGSKRPSEHEIHNFIRDQERKVKIRDLIESLQSVNSALDILKQISGSAPPKKIGGLNVREFRVDADSVSLSGEAGQTEVINRLQAALKGAAKGGRVEAGTPPAASTQGYKAFNYNFQIERRAGGE